MDKVVEASQSCHPQFQLNSPTPSNLTDFNTRNVITSDFDDLEVFHL